MSPTSFNEEIRQFRTSDGVRLTYGISRVPHAQGTLVLLHGMASNMTRWTEFVQTTELRQSWNLIRLDLRGHARSLNRGQITLQRWGDDLCELLTTEDLDRAVLVGHCMGANLAIQFAHDHADQTRGVVLIEPIVRQALKGSLQRAAQLRPLISSIIPALRLLAMCGLRRKTLPELDLQLLDTKTRALMAQHGKDFPTDRYGSVREDLRYVPLVVYLQDLLAVTAQLPLQALNDIPVLAMLCTGTGFTDRDITLAWLQSLNQCQIEAVQAAHWIPTEQPVVMRKLIERWCHVLMNGRGPA